MFIDFVLKNFAFKSMYERMIEENWYSKYGLYIINKLTKEVCVEKLKLSIIKLKAKVVLGIA